MAKFLLLVALLMTIPFAITQADSLDTALTCKQLDSQLKKLLNEKYPKRDKGFDYWTLLQWRYLTIQDLAKRGIITGKDCPTMDEMRYHVLRKYFEVIDDWDDKTHKQRISHLPNIPPSAWKNEGFELKFMLTNGTIGTTPIPGSFFWKVCQERGGTKMKALKTHTEFDDIVISAVTYICVKISNKSNIMPPYEIPGPQEQKSQTGQEWWMSKKGMLRL